MQDGASFRNLTRDITVPKEYRELLLVKNALNDI